MKIKRITPGFSCANTYIVYDENTNDGVMIDPGGMAEKLLTESQGIKIKYIILTHAHFDHIGALEEVAEKTGAQVVIHELEASSLTDSRYNLCGLAGVPENSREADKMVCDGQELLVGTISLKFIHTPGHTKGGMCIFVNDEILITGDTLFNGSIGRSDFEGGDYNTLISSIEKIICLDEKIKIYPGHGEESTIGFEKHTNPYII